MLFKVHVVVYGFLPYTILFVTNIFLAYRLLVKDRKQILQRQIESPAKRKSLTITILVMNTLFILLTMPDILANAFFLPIFINSYSGYTMLFLTDSIAFTFHASNFIVLTITNKQFLKECKDFFNIIIKKNRRSNKVAPFRPNNTVIATVTPGSGK